MKVKHQLPNMDYYKFITKKQWATVSGNGWGLEEAHVSCRQLGFWRAIESSTSLLNGQGNRTLRMDSFTCLGMHQI